MIKFHGLLFKRLKVQIIFGCNTKKMLRKREIKEMVRNPGNFISNFLRKYTKCGAKV